MPDGYPYVISNNRLPQFFQKIKGAAKPVKYSNELIKQMGFVSSNDRALIPLLKRLGFLTESAEPTAYYDRLKDSTDHPYVLAERITELYKELFAIDQEIYKASEDETKGAMSRITGKDDLTVNRYYATFKTLVGLAKFGGSPKVKETPKTKNEEIPEVKPEVKSSRIDGMLSADFHYNIQIHLPATTDISVYNAIFKSIKDNLLG